MALMAQFEVKRSTGAVSLHNVFEPDSLSKVQSGIYNISNTYPVPAGIDPVLKYQANQVRHALSTQSMPASKKRSAFMPQVLSGFSGALNEGTPNDNNMAVNNDSFVVSVLNTFIRVYNTNGVFKKNWSLEFFPKDPKASSPGVGTLDRSYDPKIVFDPVANRFIIVYLEGSESTDTRIMVAYSKTNSPLDGWNVYQLDGNPFGGKVWTDYPMIAINGEDLFITVNILRDNTDWRDGFTQSVIWQLPKSRGYNGDTLQYNLWSDLKYNGKSIWNICPVQDAFQPGKEGMYFLSVRPGDKSNDTVFLQSINHNFSSGNAEYSFKVLKSNKKYGLPPVAPQKTAGFRLQTNDARVLGAFYVNDKIQYVQTSMNTVNGRSSVYHGTVQYPDAALPEITANMISYDSVDIAYPSIASAGNKVYGRQSLITFSHSGENIFPGTSVVYYDNSGNYSDLLMVKKGQGIINSFIADTSERWGDYTSIQRRDKNPNEFWITGSYGKNTNAVGTWISKISINDPSVGIQSIAEKQMQDLDAYPNPVADVLTLPFIINADAMVQIQVYDQSGKLMLSLSENQNTGQQKAFINTSEFASGIYFYTITANAQLISNGSFSK
jgi:hypothetical protein